MKTIAVVAGNYPQFQNWLNQNRRYHPNTRFVYVDTVSDLQGLEPGTKLEKVGTYYSKPNITEIEMRISELTLLREGGAT